MHKISKSLLLVISSTLLLTSCGSKVVPELPKEEAELLNFVSSDESLDTFLNDYFRRHVGYITEDGVDMAVNTIKPGTRVDGIFNQEWNTQSLMYWNSFDSLSTDRQRSVRECLQSIPVDNYGYVWDGTDKVRATDPMASVDTQNGVHSMGWPFPNVEKSSQGYSTAWNFNGLDEADPWTSNFGAELDKGMLVGNAFNESILEFESPTLKKSRSIIPYHAPYIDLDLRYISNDYKNIDDIYVYFQNVGDTDYSNDKMVKLSEVAAINYDYSSIFEHIIYVPMYANPYWGDKEGDANGIQKIKIVIKAKSGESLNGRFGLNYVRPTYDTRFSNNNSIYISSVKYDYAYTGDVEFLTKEIINCRKAMNFYMQMYDTERHLNRQNYMVGHDGDPRKDDIVKANRIASTLSNGYWDISFTPVYDFQSNVYFYKAINDLIYLEKALQELNIEVDPHLSDVKTAARNQGYGKSTYSWTVEDLTKIASDVKSELTRTVDDNAKTGFYDPSVSRFITGYDVNGRKLDYGQVQWNLEAITYGVPTNEQATNVMKWINGDIQPQADKDLTGSYVGKDIYKFEFAPACTTLNKEDVFTAVYDDMHPVFGQKQVQFGGAIMYSSYYDLVNRVNYLGVDNAFDRLKGINNWYSKILNFHNEKDSKANPFDFYWNYYERNTEYHIQSGIRNGTGLLGLDSEFQESFVILAAIPFGFFGLDTENGKSLVVNPSMPKNLDYWKIENLAFKKIKYDLTISDKLVEISAVRGNVTDETVKVSLNMPSRNTKVFIDGNQTSEYQIIDNQVVVNIPLGAHRVEVR